MFAKNMLRKMKVSKVITNDDVVVVILEDGRKGVAKCSKEDYNDPVVGFSVAYANAMSNTANKKEFKNCINYVANKGTFEVPRKISYMVTSIKDVTIEPCRCTF